MTMGLELRLEPINYVELVEEWAIKDAHDVVRGNHARGRNAEIRLGYIKLWRLPEKEKEAHYNRYANLLETKIDHLRGGRKSYGTMPEYKEGEKYD